MDMSCIRMSWQVTINMCIMVGKRIFLIDEEKYIFEYIGKYDFLQVVAKVRMGKTTIVGVDPSLTYCALIDDVASYQLR